MSQKNYLKHFLTLSLIATLMLMNSCALKKPQFAGSNVSYSGTVYLTNGEQKSGQVRMPSPSDKAVSIIEHDETFQSSEIDRIELCVPGSTDKVKIMSYMPVKGFLKKRLATGFYVWVKAIL